LPHHRFQAPRTDSSPTSQKTTNGKSEKTTPTSRDRAFYIARNIPPRWFRAPRSPSARARHMKEDQALPSRTPTTRPVLCSRPCRFLGTALGGSLAGPSPKLWGRSEVGLASQDCALCGPCPRVACPPSGDGAANSPLWAVSMQFVSLRRVARAGQKFRRRETEFPCRPC
jgi:hypothetical protein